MRCGIARRWVQEHLEVRETSGDRRLQHFNSKRVLADVFSQEFSNCGVEEFAKALELRSLRAVPGVWRLPVWEQAGHVNSECFSLLWSWSCQARIPQRTHE